MPDEKLMRQLEKERYKGRDDYLSSGRCGTPYLPAPCFSHDNVEKLRRELARNGQLREMCGFCEKVPPAWVYTRFLKKVLKHTEEVDEIFEKLVKQLATEKPESKVDFK